MADATETLIAGLRAWTKDHDAHVRAAVELLIGNGGWLRRQDFRAACVRGTARKADVPWISWPLARAFYDSGPLGSTSQMAILDLAVALGEDQYRIGIMGHAHRRSIATAVMAACGLGEIVTPGSGKGETGG
jgi:hypothetical protein